MGSDWSSKSNVIKKTEKNKKKEKKTRSTRGGPAQPSPADFLHVSLYGLWPRKVYKYKMNSCYTLTSTLCWPGGSICAMREACPGFDPP